MSVQTCITCGKEFERRFDGPGASMNCAVCDLMQAQRERALQSAAAQPVLATTFPVTIAIIGLNVLVFVVMVLRGVSFTLPSPQDAIAFGADIGTLTLSGQWWRLFTSMFVHFGFIHLGLNMWCLWNLGRAAEQLLGKFSYLLAYIVSGLFGSIASVYWHPQAAGAGASGAIFGTAGVLVSFVYLKKTPSHLQINSKMLGSLGTFIIYNLIFGAAIPGISNAAHIGGLVMGLAVGALLPSASEPESSRRTRLSIVILLSAVALVSSALYAKRTKGTSSELTSIKQLLSQGKSDEAFTQLQQLTTAEPDLASAQALLGTLYFAKNDYPAGLAAFEKAYEDEPTNPLYQKQLGAAYLSLRKFDDATKFFKTLVAANSDDSMAHLGLGQSYLSLSNYDAAIPEFQKAAALKPNSPVPQYLIGEAQLRSGRYADAEETYGKLIQQFPDDQRARAGLAIARQQTRH
jgi:membrane associated rhomboid family serine protease/Flp pilus assembly protein TadD